MASLIVTNGQQEGSYYPLGHRTNVVGRDEALPIQILDNMVSRKHLQIRYDQASDLYFAYDMKSRNGVYVNSHRIDEVALKDGDIIMVGMTSILFTDRDFEDKESALLHYKKAGERMRATTYGPRDFEQSPISAGETGHPVPPGPSL